MKWAEINAALQSWLEGEADDDSKALVVTAARDAKWAAVIRMRYPQFRAEPHTADNDGDPPRAAEIRAIIWTAEEAAMAMARPCKIPGFFVHLWHNQLFGWTREIVAADATWYPVLVKAYEVLVEPCARLDRLMDGTTGAVAAPPPPASRHTTDIDDEYLRMFKILATTSVGHVGGLLKEQVAKGQRQQHPELFQMTVDVARAVEEAYRILQTKLVEADDQLDPGGPRDREGAQGEQAAGERRGQGDSTQAKLGGSKRKRADSVSAGLTEAKRKKGGRR